MMKFPSFEGFDLTQDRPLPNVLADTGGNALRGGADRNRHRRVWRIKSYPGRYPER
jgi:hypothetical protein